MRKMVGEFYAPEQKITELRDKIVAAIEARIQREADEGKRLAHVADREIVRHFFRELDPFFG